MNERPTHMSHGKPKTSVRVGVVYNTLPSDIETIKQNSPPIGLLCSVFNVLIKDSGVSEGSAGFKLVSRSTSES